VPSFLSVLIAEVTFYQKIQYISESIEKREE